MIAIDNNLTVYFSTPTIKKLPKRWSREKRKIVRQAALKLSYKLGEYIITWRDK